MPHRAALHPCGCPARLHAIAQVVTLPELNAAIRDDLSLNPMALITEATFADIANLVGGAVSDRLYLSED